MSGIMMFVSLIICISVFASGDLYRAENAKNRTYVGLAIIASLICVLLAYWAGYIARGGL